MPVVTPPVIVDTLPVDPTEAAVPSEPASPEVSSPVPVENPAEPVVSTPVEETPIAAPPTE